MRIFVAVGTQKFQFNRLIKAVDDYVAISGEKAFGQIGKSAYIPKNYEYKEFLSKEEFAENLIQCDIVITHSGVATIIESLKLGKPVIVIPRLKKYGEHVDDHQIQIAESFDENGLVSMCLDLEKLGDALGIVKNKKFKQYTSQRLKMIRTIEEYIESI